MKNTFTKLIALALAALFAAGLAACSKAKDSPELEHSITHFYSKKANESFFYMDGVQLSDRIGGGVTRIGTVDGTSGYILAATALYHVDETGILKLYPAAVTNAVLSLDSRFILFCAASQVFLYDHSVKEYKEIPDIDARTIVSLVLSPDGGTAGITAVDKNKGIKSYIYHANEGRTEAFGDSRVIAGAANDAALVYWFEAPDGELSGKLHCVKNGEDVLIAEKASNYLEFNRDLTEITFDIDEKTHISMNGGKAKQLADTSVFSYSGAQRASQGGQACTVLLKNTSTLLDSVFYNDITAKDDQGNTYEQYNVYYINSSLHASKLAGGATQFSVSENGKEIVCIVDDCLYRVSAYSPKAPQQLFTGAYTFCAGEDIDELYVIDRSGNLYEYRDGNVGTVQVTGVQHAKRMNNGTVICYASLEEGGTLLWYKDGRSNAIASNVAFFEVYNDFAMYLSDYDKDDNTYDLYTSTDGAEFTLGVERVEIGK